MNHPSLFIHAKSTARVSIFFGNTLYLVAIGYYTVITFLGYNALPFLQHTELLLSPLLVCGVLWIVSLFSFNIPAHIGPILAIGAGTHKIEPAVRSVAGVFRR